MSSADDPTEHWGSRRTRGASRRNPPGLTEKHPKKRVGGPLFLCTRTKTRRASNTEVYHSGEGRCVHQFAGRNPVRQDSPPAPRAGPPSPSVAEERPVGESREPQLHRGGSNLRRKKCDPRTGKKKLENCVPRKSQRDRCREPAPPADPRGGPRARAARARARARK